MNNMKIRIPLIAAALLVFAGLSSCVKPCGCNLFIPAYAFSDVYFSNFSQRDVDSVFVKLYNPGTGFSVPVDSFKTSGYGGDSLYTVQIYNLSSGRGNFDFNTSAPDLMIYLPDDSATFKITNISFGAFICEHCGLHNSYIRDVDNYYVNGVKVNTGPVTITK
jgi:hypothetical protein